MLKISDMTSTPSKNGFWMLFEITINKTTTTMTDMTWYDRLIHPMLLRAVFNIWYWTQTQGVFVCPFSAITNRKYDILSNKNVSQLNFPYCLLLLFSQIFWWNMIFFNKIWQSVANETVISLEGGNIVDILFSDKL